MNTWKPILAALVIFAAGVVTGGLTVNLRKQPAAKKPVAMPREGQLRELSRRMQAELDLTPEQRKKFAEIMKQHDDRNKRDERTARPSSPSVEKKQ